MASIYGWLDSVRGVVAAALVFTLLPFGDFAAGLEAASQDHWSPPTSAEQAFRIVTRSGVGQRVAVTLRSGEQLEGKIQAIEDDYFVVILGSGSAAEIDYDDVRHVGPIVVRSDSGSSVRGPGAPAVVAIVAGLMLAIFSFTAHNCHHRNKC
jgi:hypothetical protein